MGRKRISRQNNIYEKGHIRKKIEQKSHLKAELSMSPNEKDKHRLLEIIKMVNNVMFNNENIGYEDVYKSINELKKLKLKTKQRYYIKLCDKYISYLFTIKMVISSEPEINDSENLQEINETSNDIVNLETINNKTNVINNTVPLSSEKNKLCKNFGNLNDKEINDTTIVSYNKAPNSEIEDKEINDTTIVSCNKVPNSEIEETVLDSTENNQIVNNETSNNITTVKTKTAVNEINVISNKQASSKIEENINLPIIDKTVVEIDHQPTVLQESDKIEIDSSQEIFCSEVESGLVISENIPEAKLVHNLKFNKELRILNNTSECKKDSRLMNNYNHQTTGNIPENLPTIIDISQTDLHTKKKPRLIIPNNNLSIVDDKNLKPNNYLDTCTNSPNHYSTINKNKPPVTKSKTMVPKNLIHSNTHSHNSTKQKSKKIQANQTQQFNYSPDESSSYSEQFMYYSKQNKTLEENQNSEILNNCAKISDITLNETIPVEEKAVDNSMEMLSHQNINNSDDIFLNSVITDINLMQVTENNEITINTMNTENIVAEESERLISETEDLSSKINEKIAENGQLNKNLSKESSQNFQCDKHASPLVNIRNYEDIVVKQVIQLQEMHKSSDDRIFTFQQDNKINKIKFKSLFQKKTENTSTLRETNKISPKNTNLDVYQEVENFLNPQNRSETLDDNINQAVRQMSLEELMHNWTKIKPTYSEK